jgi:hypothetical protein
MATNKENLERWLLIKALLGSNKASEIDKIATKMIKELETNPESNKSDTNE